jgi:hypothetical protein
MEKSEKESPSASACPAHVRINADAIDLTRKRSALLEIEIGPPERVHEFFLVIDIYSASNHVHPAGHVGW